MDIERKSSINEAFIKAVNKDVELATKGKPEKPKSNLDEEERDAFKELAEQTDVLITNVDKGGTLVIWETKYYISEANRQLNVTSNHKRLPNNSTKNNP